MESTIANFSILISFLSMIISLSVLLSALYKGRVSLNVQHCENDEDGAIEIETSMESETSIRTSLVVSYLIQNKSSNPIAINYLRIGNGKQSFFCDFEEKYLSMSRSRIWPSYEGCKDYYEVAVTSSKLPVYITAYGASLVRFHFYLPTDFECKSVELVTSRKTIKINSQSSMIVEYMNKRCKYADNKSNQ